MFLLLIYIEVTKKCYKFYIHCHKLLIIIGLLKKLIAIAEAGKFVMIQADLNDCLWAFAALTHVIHVRNSVNTLQLEALHICSSLKIPVLLKK